MDLQIQCIEKAWKLFCCLEWDEMVLQAYNIQPIGFFFTRLMQAVACVQGGMANPSVFLDAPLPLIQGVSLQGCISSFQLLILRHL